MVTRVDWQEAQRRVIELAERAAKGERFLVEYGDSTVAALVGPDDLRRLEEMDTPAQKDDDQRERRFRHLLVQAGITVTRPTHPSSGPTRGPLISVDGQPISEQIIADRS